MYLCKNILGLDLGGKYSLEIKIIMIYLYWRVFILTFATIFLVKFILEI